MSAPLPRHHRGFTLIDILVAVAIAAIVLAFGVPSFRNIIQENRVSTQTSALVTALAYARSVAINRNLTVTVCPPYSTQASQTSCSGNDWTQGWHAFTTQGIVRVHEALSGGTQMDTSQGTPPQSIQYLPSGLVDTSATTFPATIGLTQGHYSKTISIDATGRTSVN